MSILKKKKAANVHLIDKDFKTDMMNISNDVKEKGGEVFSMDKNVRNLRRKIETTKKE